MNGSKLGLFIKWAKDYGLDASHPTIPMIAQFLEYLFVVKKVVPGTIRGLQDGIS